MKNVVHGVAHITGGGLLENLARILPEGARALLQRGSWQVPAVFPWLAQLGDIDAEEMETVFNMGLGLVLVVSPYYANHVRTMIEESGFECWPLGEIAAGESGAAWA